jgi:hypothetical protein
LLYGRGWNHELRTLCVCEQPHIDELRREQRVIAVVEDRLDTQRTGGLVDLVVDGEHGSAGQACRAASVESVHRQGCTAANARQHRAERIFRQREDHRNWFDLRDYNQSCGGAGAHDIADVNEPKPHTAGDWSRHA